MAVKDISIVVVVIDAFCEGITRQDCGVAPIDPAGIANKTICLELEKSRYNTRTECK